MPNGRTRYVDASDPATRMRGQEIAADRIAAHAEDRNAVMLAAGLAATEDERAPGQGREIGWAIQSHCLDRMKGRETQTPTAD